MSKMIAMRDVDVAVRRVERWGNAEDKAALSAAIALEDRQQKRQEIYALGLKIKERRRGHPREDRFTRTHALRLGRVLW
jgi:hypothetical protein